MLKSAVVRAMAAIDTAGNNRVHHVDYAIGRHNVGNSNVALFSPYTVTPVPIQS